MFGLAHFAQTHLARVRAAAERRALIESEAVQTAAKLNRAIRDNRPARWTTGDGTAVLVADMHDAHLFYAIAKARRGEYPDSYSRRTGVHALEVEALRRLLRGVH